VTKRCVATADVKITWLTRICDWLFSRPWTAEQLAERVAKSVANASYAYNWGRPVEPGTPVHPTLRHGFTELTAEEIAREEAKSA